MVWASRDQVGISASKSSSSLGHLLLQTACFPPHFWQSPEILQNSNITQILRWVQIHVTVRRNRGRRRNCGNWRRWRTSGCTPWINTMWYPGWVPEQKRSMSRRPAEIQTPCEMSLTPWYPFISVSVNVPGLCKVWPGGCSTHQMFSVYLQYIFRDSPNLPYKTRFKSKNFQETIFCGTKTAARLSPERNWG